MLKRTASKTSKKQARAQAEEERAWLYVLGARLGITDPAKLRTIEREFRRHCRKNLTNQQRKK